MTAKLDDAAAEGPSAVTARAEVDISYKALFDKTPSPTNLWTGIYNGPYTGSGEWHIFPAENGQKLAIVRSNALQSFLGQSGQIDM